MILLHRAVLLALSAAVVAAMEALHLPAALLLGPMAAAIVVAAHGTPLRMPAAPFVVAQAVIGAMLARNIPLATVTEIGRNVPLFAAGIAAVMAASALIGYLVTRWRVLPGTTGVWGCSPGGASAMTLMAEAYGADIRLVAFMQYLRVACVVGVASLVARIWIGVPAGAHAQPAWFPPVAWGPFAGTAALVALGSLAGARLRLPAAPLLVCLGVGVALQDGGLLAIELPPWLLAVAYAIVGWSIGLRFTRAILVHAARAFPRVLAAVLALIAACAGVGALLVFAGGLDPMTAYLATSPGGADSVAIIAASSDVDLPFVVAMQTARFVLVLLTGPALARFVADRAGAAPPAPDSPSPP